MVLRFPFRIIEEFIRAVKSPEFISQRITAMVEETKAYIRRSCTEYVEDINRYRQYWQSNSFFPYFVSLTVPQYLIASNIDTGQNAALVDKDVEDLEMRHKI